MPDSFDRGEIEPALEELNSVARALRERRILEAKVERDLAEQVWQFDAYVESALSNDQVRAKIVVVNAALNALIEGEGLNRAVLFEEGEDMILGKPS